MPNTELNYVQIMDVPKDKFCPPATFNDTDCLLCIAVHRGCASLRHNGLRIRLSTCTVRTCS